MKKTHYIKYHIIFISILTLQYLLSFILFDGIIFGQETDVFEAELLYNKILGDIYKKDFYIPDSLLAGIISGFTSLDHFILRIIYMLYFQLKMDIY